MNKTTLLEKAVKILQSAADNHNNMTPAHPPTTPLTNQ